MEIVQHENNTGFIEPEELKKYGPFGFWKRVKMKGIGSPKIIYLSGIPYFDAIVQEKTDLPYVNFELMEKAVLIRLSIQQECYTMAVYTKDINSIKIDLQNNKLSNKNTLDIVLNRIYDFQILSFNIPNGVVKGLDSFFKKDYFGNING